DRIPFYLSDRCYLYRYLGKRWHIICLQERQYPYDNHERLKPMSILIAEDNVAQRAYLREIIERDFPSHQPVLEAGDGEETVSLALRNRPAVCILDIQM